MGRGGHLRSGPPVKSAQQREQEGAKVRARHREKGQAGTAVEAADCDPPAHLTAAERVEWDYYAPLLAAKGRLTLEARDTLAKYCTALATVARLKRQQAEPSYRDVDLFGKANPIGTMLRQWVMVCRAYETDLILSPAVNVRAPAPPKADPKPAAGKRDFYGPLKAVK